MNIREAKLKDLQQLYKLRRIFAKFHDDLMIRKNPKVKPYRKKVKNITYFMRRKLEASIRAKNKAIIVAEDDSKILGYCMLEIKRNSPGFKLERVGHINQIFVRKEFRGKGIGSELMKAAVKWFKERKIKHLSLKVYAGNEKAYDIYKRWGFFDYATEMRKNI